MTDQEYFSYTDGLGFTPEEIQRLKEEELEDYERKVAMTPAEKRALRKWVSEGHSVAENPGSRYICTYGMYPPPDYLDVYRMDREIRSGLRGKTRAEKTAYLKEYAGYGEETPQEKQEREDAANTPDSVKEYIHKLEREVFYLWLFLSRENMEADAREYVEENRDEPIPFEFG